MRLPRNARILRGHLDATPYAMVFFLLVIFMLLASLLYTPGVHLNLPAASDLPGTDKPTVTVAIDVYGRLYFQNQRVEARDLRERLRVAAHNSREPLTLVVQADTAAPYNDILQLTLLARDAGIHDALLATLPRVVAPPGRHQTRLMSAGSPELSAPAETAPLHPGERPWSPARRWLCIALVMGAQIGLIFAFGDRKPVVPRRPTQVPELRLDGRDSDQLELDNPTLFVLPGREGFSGPAWREVSNVGFQPFRWSEPDRWLPTNLTDLGTVLSQFMQTNVYHASAFATKLAPKLNLPKSELAAAVTDAPSTLRLEGDLARRRLLYPPELPAWPGTDLLLDTVVQVLVDPAGRVLTTVLLPPRSGLPPGSGSREADQWALNLAKAMEFAPLPKEAGPTIRWTPGTLVFHWQTVPFPATNAPRSRSMSIPWIFLVYVTAPLAALCALGIYSEMRRRRFHPTPTEDRIFRCAGCGYVYTDDADVDRSRCSQCGQLNEPMEF